ncbi:hypothetical protein [Blastopirellula retiformator]|uniref:Uncharacterized protein n=1 Tax=Blastopirellula retiformator TaxID=2527970 RepID=A0A5C5VMS2_9BACT|nr:hypothetical protein [Blastopirellula retiformator]TWT39195.1 hypothetical protein Enr8_08910 [Blastopirellula retiformator]
MTHSTTGDRQPFFCTRVGAPLAAAYSPCDGCMSRFSCRGCGLTTAKKSTASATLPPFRLASSGDQSTRVSAAHEVHSSIA